MRNRRYSRWEPPVYKLSIDDEWCNETRRLAAAAIGKWITESGPAVLNLRVRDLQQWILEALAEEAIGIYAVRRSERFQKEEEQGSIPNQILDL